MHYPDSRWRPRCQGKSRDDVSGRIIIIIVGSGVTISKSVKKIFFHIFMKFEHFKGLTLNLEVPQ